MPPASNDTPPPSPGFGAEAAEDEEVMNEGDAIEVIDLDEVAGLNDDDDDEDDDEMQEEDEAAEGPPPKENATLVFGKHGKSVFNGDFHPKSDVCVTGGEDDKAYVWNWKTGEVVMETPAFKDSVVLTKFNKDGSLLAIADMAGTIKVHKVTGGGNTIDKVVWEFETSDLTWLEWHPGANVLFATTDESELWMWKIPSGDSKVYMGVGEKAEGAKILPDGKRVAVGYGDGSMRVFDLKTGDVTHNLTDGSASHSPTPVTALDARADNVLIGSGGADGLAKIFNLQSAKNIATFVHGKPVTSQSNDDVITEHCKSTVEAVLFSPAEQNLLVTGTLEGNVSVWDISSQVMRHSVNVGDGIVKMRWRNSCGGTAAAGAAAAAAAAGGHLLVATLNGKVVVVDVKTGKVIGECSGHKEAVLDFAQTSDGSRILSCSDDGECRVFDVDQVISSHGNDQETTPIRISADPAPPADEAAAAAASSSTGGGGGCCSGC